MKEGELGKTAGRTELFFRPGFQLRQAGRAAAPGKIQFPHKAGDPDIDGKGIPSPVGVKQYAAGYFGPHPGQLLQVFRGPLRGPDVRNLEKTGLTGQNLGGGSQMPGTVAELAGAQGLFPCAGQARGGGKVAVGTTEGSAQAFVDLADLDDLFQGGTDEVGEAFPGILPEGAKAGMPLPRMGQPPVPGGRGKKERVEVEIQAEVTFDGGAGKEGVVPDKAAVADGKGDGLAADPSRELPGDDLVPAKGLSAQKSGGKVQRNGELQGGHGREKLKAG